MTQPHRLDRAFVRQFVEAATPGLAAAAADGRLARARIDLREGFLRRAREAGLEVTPEIQPMLEEEMDAAVRDARLEAIPRTAPPVAPRPPYGAAAGAALIWLAAIVAVGLVVVAAARPAAGLGALLIFLGAPAAALIAYRRVLAEASADEGSVITD